MDAVELARRCADAMYAADTASQALGIVIAAVGPGTATVTMKVTDDMLNGHAICHGGHVFALADTAMAFASNTYDEVTVAAGADITFLEPVRAGAELVATAVERARRGRTGLYDVTVRAAGRSDVANADTAGAQTAGAQTVGAQTVGAQTVGARTAGAQPAVGQVVVAEFRGRTRSLGEPMLSD